MAEKIGETITFPAGIFDYGDINELIHKRIGKTGDDFGISVLFDLTTYKVFIQLANDFHISGKKSNVLYTFSTSTKTRSMPFEIQPYNYLWSKINTKTITEVTFWFTDDEDREVNLNDIDISLTVVIKTKNGN